MKKIALTLLRQVLLSFGGTYLVGDAIGGDPKVFTSDQLQMLVGAIMAIVGPTWSFFDPDKAADPNTRRVRIYGLGRHILTTLGGLCLGMGWLPEKTVDLILSLGAVALSSALSITAPEKEAMDRSMFKPDDPNLKSFLFPWFFLLLAGFATVALMSSCSVTGGKLADSIGREYDRATEQGVTTTAILHQKRNVWGAEFDFGGWAIGLGTWFVPNVDAIKGMFATDGPEISVGDPANLIVLDNTGK